jgi:hypothetical protein
MKVYISSTYSDLRAYREALFRALQKLDGVEVLGMEYFAANDIPPLERCIQEVRRSDAVILIIGHRYGFIPEGHNNSIAEIEFNEAQAVGKPVLPFIISDEALVPASSIEADPKLQNRLEAFKNRLRVSSVVGSFRSPEDLSAKATLSLFNLFREESTFRRGAEGTAELAACKREVERHKKQIEDLSVKLKNAVPAQPIWRGRRFETDELFCFALLPFQDLFFEVYESAVGPAATSLGLRSLHAGEIFGNREVVEDIWDSICSARLIVVDVTGRNPNVFYELGICHTLGKECIIITQNKDDVPFDIRHRRYVEYSPDKLVRLKSILRKTMQAILSHNIDPSQLPQWNA